MGINAISEAKYDLDVHHDDNSDSSYEPTQQRPAKHDINESQTEESKKKLDQTSLE